MHALGFGTCMQAKGGVAIISLARLSYVDYLALQADRHFSLNRETAEDEILALCSI